ncbi:MAG TPA: sigma-70 family RNA polymerase sigma factor [Candidatus Polarisedimenticolia bacterium]|jgi:RNA polymerase sigma-70 factor (ECF subfamily)
MVDERELIRRARRGDHQAFELLVGLKRERAFRIAFNIAGNEDDAKDIAQTAFIKLWSSLRSFDENSRFDPWFFRIVVNLAIDSYRKAQRGPRLVAPPSDDEAGALPAAVLPGADAGLMRAELSRIFNRLAAELAPAQRAVFTLKEIEGVPTDEIAKILGIRTSTVRNHLMQARRILQEGLRRHYPEYLRGPSR